MPIEYGQTPKYDEFLETLKEQAEYDVVQFEVHEELYVDTYEDSSTGDKYYQHVFLDTDYPPEDPVRSEETWAHIYNDDRGDEGGMIEAYFWFTEAPDDAEVRGYRDLNLNQRQNDYFTTWVMNRGRGDDYRVWIEYPSEEQRTVSGSFYFLGVRHNDDARVRIKAETDPEVIHREIETSFNYEDEYYGNEWEEDEIYPEITIYEDGDIEGIFEDGLTHDDAGTDVLEPAPLFITGYSIQPGLPQTGVELIGWPGEVIDFGYIEPVNTQINTAKDLFNIRYFSEGEFELISDIDLEDFQIPAHHPDSTDNLERDNFTEGSFPTIRNFAAKGTTQRRRVRCKFDGNGHTISNMHMSYVEGEEMNYTALFVFITERAEIKNLWLKDVDVNGLDESYYVGSLTGVVYDGADVINVHASGEVKGGGDVGGLIGDTRGDDIENPSVIERCSFRGQVRSMASYIGGVVADIGDDVHVKNCFFRGSIHGLYNIWWDGDRTVGGIGVVDGENAKMANCYTACEFVKDYDEPEQEMYIAPVAYEDYWDEEAYQIEGLYYDQEYSNIDVDDFDDLSDEEKPCTTAQMTYPYDRGSKPGVAESWQDYWMGNIEISEWAIGVSYELDELVYNNSEIYSCIEEHTSSEDNEPGEGEDWESFWHKTGGVYHGEWEEGFYENEDIVYLDDINYYCYEDHYSSEEGVYEGWDIDERARE